MAWLATTKTLKGLIPSSGAMFFPPSGRLLRLAKDSDESKGEERNAQI